METIADKKCGNQSTHLLNLLLRKVTVDNPISLWVVSLGNHS
jgi:hypothetical protein